MNTGEETGLLKTKKQLADSSSVRTYLLSGVIYWNESILAQNQLMDSTIRLNQTLLIIYFGCVLFMSL